MARLGNTTALEKERRSLDEQLGIDAKSENDLIARNARVVQDQKEYNERYDALVSRYEETEHKRDTVMEQIGQIMIRRRKIERFIESVKGAVAKTFLLQLLLPLPVLTIVRRYAPSKSSPRLF